jgi:pyridoxamine 5'-phosphate oxidase family protein
MSVFTPAELAYLQSQRLGRLATVGADSQPHVVPVGFRYNAEHDTIDIGGHGGFAKRKKYRDVRQNRRVAFVVDDLASVDPWFVRGIEIRGDTEILETGGHKIVPGFDPEMFRIRPRRIISWGLDQADSFTSHARSVP